MKVTIPTRSPSSPRASTASPRRAGRRTHEHELPFSVGSAMVFDEAYGRPRSANESIVACTMPGDGEVIRIRRLPAREENVRVLSRAPHIGGVRAHAPAAELDNGVGVDQSGHVLGREGDYFRQLMGSPEPVEEVEERYSRPQGGSMGDQGKSCASWTELDASMAQPVVRACMTSEWSPKIDRA